MTKQLRHFGRHFDFLTEKQDKKTRFALTLSAFGILLFIIIALTLPLRDRFLELLFPKHPSEAAETWVVVGTHPGAAVQPTSQGKALRTLQVWNGKIYAGYGDFDQNKGPIAISPFDPITKTFTQEHISNTEAIYHYRIINNKLFAPAIDSRGSPGAAYAVEDSPGVWRDVTTVIPEHNFDMATLTGSDLWIVGSSGSNHAVAWRSVDNGTTWTKSLDHFNASATAWRFHFAGVLNGKLYVQAKDDFSATVDTVSKVFDGTSWSDGPNLLPSSNIGGWRPMNFAGKLVYLPGNLGGGLLRFDGTTFSNVTSPEGASTFRVYDMQIVGNELFVLSTQPGTSNRAIYKTSNLTNWTKVASNVPAFTIWSLAVLNGKYYIGTYDSKIYEYTPSLPTSTPTLTPTPTAAPIPTPTDVVPTNTPTPTPTLTPTPTPQSINLVGNPSFEVLSSGFPISWQRRNSLLADTTIIHTGQISLKVTGGNGYTFAQNLPALKPNTTYTLSSWIKTQGVTTTTGMTVRYAVTLTSPDIYLASPPVKGTTDWTRVTRTFTTAPNYQAGRLDLLYNVNTGATAWFDDVALCEGTQACL